MVLFWSFNTNLFPKFIILDFNHFSHRLFENHSHFSVLIWGTDLNSWCPHLRLIEIHGNTKKPNNLATLQVNNSPYILVRMNLEGDSSFHFWQIKSLEIIISVLNNKKKKLNKLKINDCCYIHQIIEVARQTTTLESGETWIQRIIVKMSLPTEESARNINW